MEHNIQYFDALSSLNFVDWILKAALMGHSIAVLTTWEEDYIAFCYRPLKYMQILESSFDYLSLVRQTAKLVFNTSPIGRM
jgi:hypothetical protein